MLMRHAAESLERTNAETSLILINTRLKLPQFINTDNGTGGDRTHGLSLRRRSLYPTELQPHKSWELGVWSSDMRRNPLLGGVPVGRGG
jgi:hypothetical protein